MAKVAQIETVLVRRTLKAEYVQYEKVLSKSNLFFFLNDFPAIVLLRILVGRAKANLVQGLV